MAMEGLDQVEMSGWIGHVASQGDVVALMRGDSLC
jgi:hypothetical protein